MLRKIEIWLRKKQWIIGVIADCLQIIGVIVAIIVIIVGIYYSEDTRMNLFLMQFEGKIVDISKKIDFYKYEVFLPAIILVMLGYWIRLRHAKAKVARYEGALADVSSTKGIHAEIFRLFNQYHLNDGKSAEGFGVRELQIFVHECLRSSCSRLASAITHLTGDETHVCLKTFRPDTGMVEPVVRDENRGKYNRPPGRQFDCYHYEGNTGLSDIIRKQRETYNCDNLTALGSEYTNKGGDWSEYYNATIIQALNNHAHMSSDHIKGFICLDNMRGGLGHPLVRNLLLEFSVLYCRVFDAITAISGDITYKNPVPQVVEKIPGKEVSED